jgi:hypothetical protein
VSDDAPPKDLTGILELPPVEETPSESTADSTAFPVTEPEAAPPLDHFGSLEEEQAVFDAAGGHSLPAEPDPFAVAPSADPSAPPESEPIPSDVESDEAVFAPEAEAAPEPAQLPAAPTDALSGIKDYSERVAVGAPVIEASFPFHLWIEGPLSELEKEKLLELISRENLGVREMDLEPQIEAGKIKLPRISEFAAILIAQKLRSTRARIRLIPADLDHDEMIPSESGTSEQFSLYSTEPLHPAERIAITPLPELPSLPTFQVVDAVTASLILTTTAVEASSSAEYEEALEAIQRELKYKAHRKGATAILNFSITLTPLSAPSRYRVTAIGSAVRAG